MKKLAFARKTAAVAASLALTLGLSSCGLLFGWLIDEDAGTVAPYETITIDANQSVSFAEIPVEAKKLIINNAAGKNIYIVKTNPSENVIDARQTQYVASGTNIDFNQPNDGSRSIYTQTEDDLNVDLDELCKEWFSGHAEIPVMTIPVLEGGSSARAISSGTEVMPSSTPAELQIGAKKEIFIDTNPGLDSYRKANATLRAIGTNCYVWVVEGFYEGEQTGKYSDYTVDPAEQLSSIDVNRIARNFETLYPAVRNVFGNESDNMYYADSSGNWPLGSMQTRSATGTKVNIVIYDIGNDSDNPGNSFTTGYFHSKDYFPSEKTLIAACGKNYSSEDDAKYSNEGKYFYIDAWSYKCNPQESYSTLAHEFQHMVNWGVKHMEHRLDPNSDPAYNEMLSMLCEDLLMGTLELAPAASPMNRLPTFNRLYYLSGAELRRDEANLVSYATNYAFGAWLARTYGGIDLIHEISTNKYYGKESIVKAVEKLNSSKGSFSMERLLKEFTKECLVSTANFSQDYYKIYNYDPVRSFKNNKSETYNGYDYTLQPINLLNLEETLGKEFSKTYNNGNFYQYAGPKLLLTSQKSNEIRPCGFILEYVGQVNNSNQAIINFGNTRSVSKNEKMYIYIL